MANKLFVNEACEQSIKRISKGDLNALTVIYDCVGRLIFTVAFSIIGDYQLAQDVMQDTFVQIIDHAHTYRGCGNAKAWIVSIARNLALNVMKERNHITDIGCNFDKAVYPFSEEKLITSVALSDALAQLTTTEKEIVVYKTVCNFSHKQIAQLMNITVPNSRQKYKRAIEKLRSYYFYEGGEIYVQKQENSKQVKKGI